MALANVCFACSNGPYGIDAALDAQHCSTKHSHVARANAGWSSAIIDHRQDRRPSIAVQSAACHSDGGA